MLRNALVSQTLHGQDGILISLKPGHIIFQGERCTHIISTEVTDPGLSRMKEPDTVRFQPYDIGHILDLSSYFRLINQQVFVTMNIEVSEPNLLELPRRIASTRPVQVVNNWGINPELVAETLSKLLVTRACGHDYYEPLPENIHEILLEHMEWHEGLTMHVASARSHAAVAAQSAQITPRFRVFLPSGGHVQSRSVANLPFLIWNRMHFHPTGKCVPWVYLDISSKIG